MLEAWKDGKLRHSGMRKKQRTRTFKFTFTTELLRVVERTAACGRNMACERLGESASEASTAVQAAQESWTK